MANTGNRFTAGERRGMLLMLLILSVIIACAYFYSNHNIAEYSHETDTISSAQLRNIIDHDTIKQYQKKKNKKNKQNIIPKKVPVRDPLSQPVPYDNR